MFASSGNNPLSQMTVVVTRGSIDASIACIPPHDIPMAATWLTASRPEYFEPRLAFSAMAQSSASMN